jgi:hypothetical protein
MLLSAPSVMNGLHVVSDISFMPLQVLSREGKVTELRVEAEPFDSDDDLSWYWRRETAPSRDCVTVTPVGDDAQWYWRNIERSYWYEHLEKVKAVYLGFNLTVNDPDEGFSRFIGRMWDAVDHNSTERLIIDLRHNLGGDHDILPPLVEGIERRTRINRRGNLFVIIGPRNVSASAHCAAWLQKRTQAIFVGEPTGARLNQYADPRHVRLPHSKLRLMVSHVFWRNDYDDRSERLWIEPDMPAAFDSTAYFGLRDTAMEKIVEAFGGVS